MTRGTVPLVVVSSDGERVLARPNGLAGWGLPSLAVDLPHRKWTTGELERAASIVGGAVEPVLALAPAGWLMRQTGRIAAAGTTWIRRGELDRLGADAGVAAVGLDADATSRSD